MVIPDRQQILPEPDLPAAELLIEEATRRRKRGGEFCIQTKIARTIQQLERYSVTEHLGSKGVHMSKGDAIAYLVPRLDGAVCAGCKARIFAECAAMPGAEIIEPTEGPARSGAA